MSEVWEYIKQQGFSIAILCSAIFWFNQKYDKQQDQIDNLNVYIRTTLSEQLEANTTAFRELKFSVDNQNKYEKGNQ